MALVKIQFMGGGASVPFFLVVFTIEIGDFYQILLSMYSKRIRKKFSCNSVRKVRA